MAKKNIIQYLLETVKRVPKKVAVDDGNEKITFSDLLDSAKKIAIAIHDCELHNCPIGVYLSKSCKMIQSFAGISLSGNFYIPLDTKSPSERVNSILNIVDAQLIITDKMHVKAMGVFGRKYVLLEDLLAFDTPNDEIIDGLLEYQIDLDPAYSIFTSGSTGTPKGVVISHKSVIDFIDWEIKRFNIDCNLRIGNQVPFYFDVSVSDIYLMYATGSTLIIIPEVYFSFPAKLVNFLNEKEINFVFWVPFVLINVANFDIFSEYKPKYLKNIFFAGEVMPNRHLNYWRKHLPDCRYVNLYGPTEITVISTYYEVDRTFEDNESLPIGYPCENCRNMILVDDKREASVNEKGELCIEGTCLALGYYGDWEKTNKSFIQNPLNNHYNDKIYLTGDIVYKNTYGEIIYCGRKDSQIKHNGYRIELGEIENGVLSSHMVDNCCCVYDFINKKIILFYESKNDLILGKFRKEVGLKVPRYMLPNEYIHEDYLKRNANGKIDRAYYNKLINKQ